jgi:hypothetical protein
VITRTFGKILVKLLILETPAEISQGQRPQGTSEAWGWLREK